MKQADFPVHGEARHTCPRCKIRTKYTGLLYLSNLNPDKLVRLPIRSCPVCNLAVLPVEVT